MKKLSVPLLFSLSLGMNLIALTRTPPSSVVLSGIEASPFYFRMLSWVALGVTLLLGLACFRSRFIVLPKVLPKNAESDARFYLALFLACFSLISSASLLVAVLQLESGRRLAWWLVAVTLVFMLALLFLGILFTRRLIRRYGAVEPEMSEEEERKILKDFMESCQQSSHKRSK